MTLDFEKVSDQVQRMGRALAARATDLDGRLAEAWEYFQALDDLGAIHDRVRLARDRDAGYRGAALPDEYLEIIEPINESYPLPPIPERATILAADGSQIYPNIHAAALYYLTNIGVFIYHHGVDQLPDEIIETQLHYAENDVYNEYGLISNEGVNKRRTVMELEVLSREVWHQQDNDCPMLAISDGGLLFWAAKETMPRNDDLENAYIGRLIHLHDAHAHMQRTWNQSASLIGYVDRPTSSFLISLLHLMKLAEKNEQDVTKRTLKTNGEWEGLTDRQLLFRLLRNEPGARSAIMVQQSPQNKVYHDHPKGESIEIAFFYLNVGPLNDCQIARVEMPMWVARDAVAVDRVQALVYDQCQMMWRYPYALTRADELAVVRGQEKLRLDNMIKQVLLENKQNIEETQKSMSKVVRHGRTRYGQKRG